MGVRYAGRRGRVRPADERALLRRVRRKGMTLVNRLKSIQPRISASVNMKAATLDIERIPGQHSTGHRGQTITGPFWVLNEIKGWTGKRIHADDVKEWPRTICAAWKWYDSADTVFAAEWEVGGYDGFM